MLQYTVGIKRYKSYIDDTAAQYKFTFCWAQIQ